MTLVDVGNEAAKYVTLEERGGHAVLTMNREGDPYNKIDPGFTQALRRSFGYCDGSRHIKAVVLTGKGRVFSAGADLATMANLDPDTAQQMAGLGTELNVMMEYISPVVVGAINGICLGGGFELALSCDYRIASNKALIGQTEINLGMIPGGGGTQRLSRLVGRSKGIRVACGGETFRAKEALEMGLVDEVVAHEKLLDRAVEFCSLFENKSKPAIRLAKMAINQGLHLPLWYGILLESQLFARSWGLEDRAEGVKAFLEKRRPEFRDK